MGDDPEGALRLYRWGTQMAAAWFEHLSYIEILVRNTIDRILREWNKTQTRADGAAFTAEWTLEHNTAPLIYDILRGTLRNARDSAVNVANERPAEHPRYETQITHADIFSQITLGSWTKLLDSARGWNSANKQRALWQECLHKAFPGAYQTDNGRRFIGLRLEALRVLRNRIAHHENILHVEHIERLKDSLAVLRAIDPDLPGLVMRSNRIRSLVKQDPRLSR